MHVFVRCLLKVNGVDETMRISKYYDDSSAIQNIIIRFPRSTERRVKKYMIFLYFIKYPFVWSWTIGNLLKLIMQLLNVEYRNTLFSS